MVSLKRSWATAAAMVVALTVGPATVRAQENEAVVQKMVDLNRKALTAFEGKNLEAAKEALLDAVVAGKEAGLATHKMMARTYLHLGAIHIEGFKDRAKGIRYLVLALKIRPDIEITPSLVTPALADAFQAAKREAAGGKPEEPPAAKPAAPAAAKPPAPPPAPPPPKPAPFADAPKKAPDPPPLAPPPPKPAPLLDGPKKEAEPAKKESEPAAAKPKKTKPDAPDEPDLPANVPQQLYCPNPDEAPPKEQIALRCVTKPGAEVARVLLFYRLPGGEKFTAVPTTRSPKGWYNGVIPAHAVVGRMVQYYFEARDSTDKVSGHAGRSDSPNLMLIRSGAPSVGKGTLAMLRYQKKQGENVRLDEDPLAGIVEEKERASREAGVHRRTPGSVIVGALVGSGYGWHPRAQLESKTDLHVQAGLGSGGTAHVLPEIGYQWSESLAFSLQARLQFIGESGSGDTAKNATAPKHSAIAVLARGTYFRGDGNVQLFASGLLGGGEGFRLVVPPKPAQMLPRNDTVRGGPVVAGAAVGFMYHFTRFLAWATEVRGLLGGPTFAAVADLATGVQLAF